MRLIALVLLFVVTDVSSADAPVGQWECVDRTQAALTLLTCYRLDESIRAFEKLSRDCDLEPFDKFQLAIARIMSGDRDAGFKTMSVAIQDAENRNDDALAEVLKREEAALRSRLDQIESISFQELQAEAARRNPECKKKHE